VDQLDQKAEPGDLEYSRFSAAIPAGQRGEVSVNVMRDACDEAYGAARDRLDALWEDCSSTSRDLFRLVNEESSILGAQAAGTDAECLIERGFVHVSGNKLHRPNRLLARFLGELPNEATAMARLLGAKDRYEANLRGVFERRLAQLDGLDATYGSTSLMARRICRITPKWFSLTFEASWIGCSN
jgi:hypothetical protein